MSGPDDRTAPRPASTGEGPSASELEQARREALRLKMTRRPLGASGSIARAFLESKLTPLLVVFSLLLGAFAVLVTPREEEPQIKVPMIDVLVGFPGRDRRGGRAPRASRPSRSALRDPERRVHLLHLAALGRADHRPLHGRDRPRPGGRQGPHEDRRVRPTACRPGPCRRSSIPRAIDDVPVAGLHPVARDASPMQLQAGRRGVKVELTRHPRVAQVTVLGGERQRGPGATSTATASRPTTSPSSRPTWPCAPSTGAFRPAAFVTANAEIQVEVGPFLRDADEVGGGRGRSVRTEARVPARRRPGRGRRRRSRRSTSGWARSGGRGEGASTAPGSTRPPSPLPSPRSPGPTPSSWSQDLDRVARAAEGHGRPVRTSRSRRRATTATPPTRSRTSSSSTWRSRRSRSSS